MIRSVAVGERGGGSDREDNGQSHGKSRTHNACVERRFALSGNCSEQLARLMNMCRVAL